MMKRYGMILASVMATTAVAQAQPQEPTGPPPDQQIGSDDDGATQLTPPRPQPPPDDPLVTNDIDPTTNPYVAPPTVPGFRKRKHAPIGMPELLTTPTGWLLPAAVLYSRTSLDTGGGLSSDTRVGLGDVAEFGLATTDAVRERQNDDDKRATRIQPYVTASFRIGVSEDRLFEGQPGLALGFRKSFERNHDGYKTRIAELTLVASKNLGKNVAIHVGGAFWDASLAGYLQDGATEREEVTFHDGAVSNQVRAFGGIELRPLPRSQILVDLGWAPEFCYRCLATEDKIQLKPTLSYGVRYAVADFMNLEAGVRIPDIGEANLLDAQIFGQVTFVSRALRRAVESLK